MVQYTSHPKRWNLSLASPSGVRDTGQPSSGSGTLVTFHSGTNSFPDFSMDENDGTLIDYHRTYYYCGWKSGTLHFAWALPGHQAIPAPHIEHITLLEGLVGHKDTNKQRYNPPGVSINGGTPQFSSKFLVGIFHEINHPAIGDPPFPEKTHLGFQNGYSMLWYLQWWYRT